MKEILAKLVEGKDLTKEEAMKAQELILTGQATEAQIACFLTALRMKGETLDEITGLAAILRNKANTISPKVKDYVDFVGTGGNPCSVKVMKGFFVSIPIISQCPVMVSFPLLFSFSAA